MNVKRLTRMANRILVALLLLASLLAVPRPAWAATYTVTNTNDSGSGSLRQAIIDANNNPGPDTIAFNIPQSDPGYWPFTSAWVIQLSSLLPSLTGGGTTIDGATQTTNQGDTNIFGPEVEIDGSLLSSTSSIFYVESNANIIQGLALTRAGAAAIKVIGGASGNIIKDNYVGTDPTGTWAWGNGSGVEVFGGANGNVIAHNVISGNTVDGIMVAGSGTNNNMIRRNTIGLDPSGVVAIPNGRHGVLILNGPMGTTVGGEAGYRNYIGGNAMHGVYITDSGMGTFLNSVTHNYIGIDAFGTGGVDVGNGYSGVAISDGAMANWVTDNVISGNHEHGVYITGSGTNSNMVWRNIVGANAQVTGLVPNGQHGVAIYAGAQFNAIGSTTSISLGNVIVGSGWSGVVIVNPNSNRNTVGYNAIGTDASGTATNLGNNYYGIHVVDGAGNQIGFNEIAYNGTHTTAAGVRVEGTGAISNTISQNSIHDNSGKGIELVNGGNAGLFTPSISTATCSQVEGSACAGCTVEIFSDSADEGRIYEGAGSAHAILAAFSWSGTVNGPNLTVTATDSQGNTSEFSAPFTVGPCGNTAPTATFTVTPTSGYTSTVFSFDASACSDPEDTNPAVLQVRWDWENNGIYDTGWSTTKTANYSYTSVGTYTVRLQVMDTLGLKDTATHQVVVIEEHRVLLPLVVRNS